MLFETAKDMGTKKAEVIAFARGGAEATMDESTANAKGAFATARRIEKMLVEPTAARASDDAAALSIGHLQLLHELLKLEETEPGCVAKLSPALDVFRRECSARPRIAQYLASGLRFPTTFNDLGQEGGYAYSAGPKSRADFLHGFKA